MVIMVNRQIIQLYLIPSVELPLQDNPCFLLPCCIWVQFDTPRFWSEKTTSWFLCVCGVAVFTSRPSSSFSFCAWWKLNTLNSIIDFLELHYTTIKNFNHSEIVIFVMYLYPRHIRRKIALQGVKIGNLFHTDPRCGKSWGYLNMTKMCHDIDILALWLCFD